MTDNQDTRAALKESAGVDVSHCYQCGKCSAGCVQAERMDYPPSYVMRLLQTGDPADYRTALSSRTIWLCLNCENCYQRCPMSIDIPAVMDSLRQQALREGVQHRDARKIIAFHRAFLAQVKNTGRLYEVGMEAQYKLSTGDLFQDVSLVPSMLSKGKLGLFPEGIKDRKAMRRIFDAAASRTKGSAGRTSGNGKEKKKEDER